jgi:hypothetical protein
MSNSANLSLPYLAQGQAQKEVTHNDALNVLDAVVQLSVKSRAITAPPGSPAQGDRYIVPAGASGAWSGQTGKVAIHRDTAWAFYSPRPGWQAIVEAEGRELVFLNGAWQPFQVITPNGAGLGMAISEEEVSPSGASTTTSIVIPNRSICLGVSVRTTLAITGATSFSCGVSGNTSKFGTSLGVTLGATNVGIIGPEAFYADTPVVLTSAGGSFTGGKVRVAIQHLTFAAPSQ